MRATETESTSLVRAGPGGRGRESVLTQPNAGSQMEVKEASLRQKKTPTYALGKVLHACTKRGDGIGLVVEKIQKA